MRHTPLDDNDAIKYISDRKDAAYNVLSDWVWKSTAISVAVLFGAALWHCILLWADMLK